MVDERREWAIKRIRAKREFWVHLFVYFAVNTFLVVIWAVTSGGYFWPIWPMLGWAIGLGAHGLSVFAGPRQITEERINRELEGRYESRSAPLGRP